MKAAHRFLSCLLLCGAAAVTAFSASAQAKPFKILHSFAGGSDGANPYTPPVMANNDFLYGTTNGNTVYQIAPDGTETVLHVFDGGVGGDTPNGAPAFDPKSAALYGTTAFGGTADKGILWKLTKHGKFSVLHEFDGKNDGSGPQGQLVWDQSGNLYGAAAGGGGNFNGTLFRYGSDGSFTVLHTFAENDGINPHGSLTRDEGGNLYGVTFKGGAHSGGTVYQLAPDGTYTVLHAFTAHDGAMPFGGLARDKAGNLYGTTGEYGHGGAGTLFKLTPKGKFTVLHAFTGKADGGNPQGDLLRIGKYLYGTTDIGGDKDCSCGVVFKMTLDGSETVLHAFTGGTSDGSIPFAGVTKGKAGVVYGATFAGGASNKGIVFSVKS